MINAYGYLMLESKDDLKNPIFDAENRTRINCGVVYHNGDRENYPQFYKYEEPWDSHFCGDFFPCEREEFLTEIENRINNTKILYEKIKNA